MNAPLLALLFALLVACGGATADVRPEAPPPSEVAGCYVGASDPTVLAGDARRRADAAARSHVATAVLGSHIRSADLVTAWARDHVAVTLEQTRGFLQGVAVVGWWRDREGVGPTGACDHGCTPDTLWAVACLLGREGEAAAALAPAFDDALPAWIHPPHSRAGELCAVGVSGSTIRPDDATAQAEADARRRLAMLLCAEVDDVRVDHGARAWSFVDQHPSAEALEAAAAATLHQTWTDEAGAGPLTEAGVAYARVCVSPPRLACGIP